MPHDKYNRALKAGDAVRIEFRVTDVQSNEDYCNVNLESVLPCKPGDHASALCCNASQAELILTPAQAIVQRLEKFAGDTLAEIEHLFHRANRAAAIKQYINPEQTEIHAVLSSEITALEQHPLANPEHPVLSLPSGQFANVGYCEEPAGSAEGNHNPEADSASNEPITPVESAPIPTESSSSTAEPVTN